jgi:thiamine transport system permease protein
MRRQVGALRAAAIPGLIIVVGLGGFVLLALAMLFVAGGDLPFDRLLGPYTQRVFGFTLTQAFLSTVLSMLGGLPLAVLLHRHAHFAGRDLVVRLLTLPLALPPLVAVLGLLDVWGRSGFVSTVMQSLGLDVRLDIFGLQGVLLAHVFFNMPLAARLMLAHLDRQPSTTFRLADQLGLVGWARFWRLEAPLLAVHLPGIAGLIAMLCIGSFTIVLTLGGGPSAATFEVAIYQALRFDFDPSLAALYTLVQLALAGSLVVLLKIVSALLANTQALPALCPYGVCCCWCSAGSSCLHRCSLLPLVA